MIIHTQQTRVQNVMSECEEVKDKMGKYLSMVSAWARARCSFYPKWPFPVETFLSVKNETKDQSIRYIHSGLYIFYFLQCLLCCLVHLLAFLNLFYQSDTFCIPCRDIDSFGKHEHLHF